MENKLKLIIAELFGVEENTIQNDSGVVKGDILNWDSLGQLQLILKIEDSFNVKFTMEEIKQMQDYSTILNMLTSKTIT